MYYKHNRKIIQIPEDAAKSSENKWATDMNQSHPVREY